LKPIRGVDEICKPPHKHRIVEKKKENIIISRTLPTGRKNIILKILPKAREKNKNKNYFHGND
jgi:hypothetical protein